MNAIAIQRDVPQIRDRSIERLQLNRLSKFDLTNPLIVFDFMKAPMPSKESSLINEQIESKATIYVRVPSQLHRRARVQALTEGINMGQLIVAALELYLIETEKEVSP